MFNYFSSLLLALSLVSCAPKQAPLYREVKLLKYSDTSLNRSLDQLPEELSATVQEKLWEISEQEPPGFYYDSISGAIGYTYYTDFTPEDAVRYSKTKDMEALLSQHTLRSNIGKPGEAPQFENSKKRMACQGDKAAYLDDQQTLKVLIEKQSDSLTYGLRVSFLKKSNDQWRLYDQFTIPDQQIQYAVQCVAVVHPAKNGPIIYIQTAYEWMSNKWSQDILLLPSDKLTISELK